MAITELRSRVLENPLMSRGARAQRILNNPALSGLGLTSRSGAISRAIAADDAMLQKAFSGQIFPDVERVAYEGPESRNPLSYKAYDPSMVVEGMTLQDHFKISFTYWHGLRGDGTDPFGGGTIARPWDSMRDPLAQGIVRMFGGFQIMDALGIKHYAFHDYDLIDGQGTLADLHPQLDLLSATAKALQEKYGINLAWNTNQMFALPVYMDGAATSPDSWPYLRAIAQCKQSISMAISQGAKGFVFWGGREGFIDLINTKTPMEKQNLAIFLREVIAMAREMGYQGEFWIEPKACEPTIRQYDRDVEIVIGFLHEYGLTDLLKINFEPNHGELAGLDADQQLDAAGKYLGSIDINRGLPHTGWDVDLYTDIPTARSVMRAVRNLRAQGGFTNGFMNVDAKVRRTSTRFPEDLMHGFIATADNLTAGLLLAVHEDEFGLSAAVEQRYASWGTGLGAEIRQGQWNGRFGELADLVVARESELSHPLASGRIEELVSARDQWLIGAIMAQHRRGN